MWYNGGTGREGSIEHPGPQIVKSHQGRITMGRKKDAVDEATETMDQDTKIVVEGPATEKVAKEKAPTKAGLTAAEVATVDWTDQEYYGAGPFRVISRAAAVILGFGRYYTGIKCKEGHDSPRKTKTSTCLACSRTKLRERHKNRIKEDVDYKARFAEKAKARRAKKTAANKASQPEVAGSIAE